jgi:hypothetical protein
MLLLVLENVQISYWERRILFCCILIWLQFPLPPSPDYLAPIFFGLFDYIAGIFNSAVPRDKE